MGASEFRLPRVGAAFADGGRNAVMGGDAWALEAGTILRNGIVCPAPGVIAALDGPDASALRKACSGLRFSRTTIAAGVRLYGEFPTSLQWSPGGTKAGTFHSFGWEADSVVIGKTWHPLNVETITAASDIISRHQLRDKPLTLGRYLRLLADPLAFDFIIDDIRQDALKYWRIDSSLREPPKGLTAKLYPYQVEGSAILRSLTRFETGSLLADEMGLGKTVQLISVVVDQPNGCRSLIIVPASLLANWNRELATFAPTLTVLTHTGPNRRGVSAALHGYDVVLTTYETTVSDVYLLGAICWDLVVLDEAQQIRNPETQRSATVKGLRRTCSIAVTGTPIQNRLADLWSISEFILPSLLGGRSAFEASFPDERSAAERLGRIVAPITVRRRVKDVAKDLPPLIEIRTPISMNQDDATEYAELSSAGGLESHSARVTFCAHVTRDVSDDLQWFRGRAKVQHLEALLSEIFETGEKSLVFASYQTVLDNLLAVSQMIEEYGFHAVIDGRTPVPRRQAIVDHFSRHIGAACLFLNPAAAGVGLNIAAANHVIHFNPGYNPAVTDQATARAYRRLQERPVFAHHLYYTDTVEERAVGISTEKRELADGMDDGVRASTQTERNEHGR